MGALKPCPFCGSDVTLETGGETDGLLKFVCAEGSACRGGRVFTCCLAEDWGTAIATWNTRTPSEAVLVEALAKLADLSDRAARCVNSTVMRNDFLRELADVTAALAAAKGERV